MTNSKILAAAVAAALSAGLTTSAHAHGDSGGGGGTVLPPGITLVSFDYDFTKYNQISDARLTSLAQQGLGEIHSLKTISVPALTLGYGLTRNLTIAARLPYLLNQDIREADPSIPGVDARGGVSGFGDVSLTGTYRFYDNHETELSAALIAGFKAPTGATGKLDNSGIRFETEHQPGSGSWDGIVGGIVSRELDAFTLSGNVLYQFMGKGTADAKLGDRFSYGVTVSYRVWSSYGGNEQPSAYRLGGRFDGMMHHGGPHENDEGRQQHDTDAGEGAFEHSGERSGVAVDVSLGLNGEWMGKNETAGEIDGNTGGNILYITPGLKLSLDNWSGYVNAGLPVASDFNGIQSDPDWRLTTGMSVQF